MDGWFGGSSTDAIDAFGFLNAGRQFTLGISLVPLAAMFSGVDGTQYVGEPIWENPRSNLNPSPSSSSSSSNDIRRTPTPPTEPSNYPDYLRMILTAPVYEVANETPLTHAINLSARYNCGLYLKREDLQPVFSFKLRGAYNRMAQLTAEERERGVVCASAGNHAQGVALAAKKMGIEATIVMPLATPPIKVKNVERLGGKAVLYGQDFDEAKKKRQMLIDVGFRQAPKQRSNTFFASHNLCSTFNLQELGLVDIHPYDDPYVIAGQGTIAVEILRQLPPAVTLASLDAIFACVGGGGLLAGIAAYIKRVAPHVKVIGVETYDADAMTRSLKEGKRVELPEVGLFADGAAVRLVGEETFRIAQDLVDAMILVSTDEICAAIKDVFEDTRGIVEPAGALSVAGFKKYIAAGKGRAGGNYVAVTSGANMNFDRLRFVSERAELGEKREALVSVVVPEKPGRFVQASETRFASG